MKNGTNTKPGMHTMHVLSSVSPHEIVALSNPCHSVVLRMRRHKGHGSSNREMQRVNRCKPRQRMYGFLRPDSPVLALN